MELCPGCIGGGPPFPKPSLVLSVESLWGAGAGAAARVGLRALSQACKTSSELLSAGVEAALVSISFRTASARLVVLELGKSTSSTSLFGALALLSLENWRVHMQINTIRMMAPKLTLMATRAMKALFRAGVVRVSPGDGVIVAAEIDTPVVLASFDEALFCRIPKFELGIVTGGAAGVNFADMETIVPIGAIMGWREGVEVSGSLDKGLIVRIEKEMASRIEESVLLRRATGSGIIRVVVLV
jgi:hypothetical protein